MTIYKMQISQYISSNMEKWGDTLKSLSDRSGVPSSSIHSYVQGRVNHPDEENLIRIAAAFGDPPEVIAQMRRESHAAMSAEAKLIAGADDKQRMEQLASVMRTSMISVLEEQRAASSAQQDELAAQTERRIEAERARFKERAAEVVRQCEEETARIRASCDERVRLTEAHCAQRIEDSRQHMSDVLSERRQIFNHLRMQYNVNVSYLKSSVRNLCVACFILLVTNIFFGAYAIFAYTTFDMSDPSRGLHRETHSIGPMMLFLAVVAVGVSVALIVSIIIKRPAVSSVEEAAP
ncbi:MAG: hypothetical protein J6K32_08275 [Clostridia bacterium]|nr:hypothetical protein [Clostridia bacterium]